MNHTLLVNARITLRELKEEARKVINAMVDEARHYQDKAAHDKFPPPHPLDYTVNRATALANKIECYENIVRSLAGAFATGRIVCNNGGLNLPVDAAELQEMADEHGWENDALIKKNEE